MKNVLSLVLLLVAMLGMSVWADTAPVAFLGIGPPAIPAGLPPTGSASGDLTGSYPSPTVTAARFATPGAIGSTTASTGAFTTLTSKSLTNNGTTDSIIISNGATGSKAYYGMAINGVTLSYLFCNSAAIPLAFNDNANAWNPMTYTAGAVGAGHVDWAGTLDASAVGTASQTIAGGFSVAKSEFVGGDIVVAVAGKQLKIKEGSNAAMGTAVLVAGTLVVSNTLVTANTRIFLTSQVDGGTPGFLRVSARSAGTSFTILSSSGTDTSTVAWRFIEPAP